MDAPHIVLFLNAVVSFIARSVSDRHHLCTAKEILLLKSLVCSQNRSACLYW